MSLVTALRRSWPEHQSHVTTALVATLTLGLAPFVPHPHVYKQLVNLAAGTLTAPMDIFDLVLHGAPWLALVLFTGLWLGAALRPPVTAPQGH